MEPHFLVRENETIETLPQGHKKNYRVFGTACTRACARARARARASLGRV